MPEAIARPLAVVSSRTKMPVAATIVMGVLALAACFIPFDVLLNATGSTLAFSYGFIALAAFAVRRRRDGVGGTAPGTAASIDQDPADEAAASAGMPAAASAPGYRMPLWPLPPAIALLAIGAIFVIGILDPAQWLSLGIAFGIVGAGFAYYALYLRRSPAALHLLHGDDDEEFSA
jgi:amino acid transporter